MHVVSKHSAAPVTVAQLEQVTAHCHVPTAGFPAGTCKASASPVLGAAVPLPHSLSTAHHTRRPAPTSPYRRCAAPIVLLQAVYNFWQYELCDVFIELMKPVMALDDAGGCQAGLRGEFCCPRKRVV